MAILAALPLTNCTREKVIAGDGQVVDRVEHFRAPTGGRLTIVLTRNSTLGAVINHRILSELAPGMTKDEAVKRLGAPVDIVTDERGDLWSRWRYPEGFIEVGNPDIGSGEGPENRRWTVRIDPASRAIRELLGLPLHRYLEDGAYPEVVVESPAEQRRLWITMQDGDIKRAYFLRTADRVAVGGH